MKMSPGQFGVFLAPALCASVVMCASSALTGTGEGTQHFARLMLSPVSLSEGLALLGLAYWAVVGVLLGFRAKLACRILAGVALLTHYAGAYLLGERENWSFVGRAWQAAPAVVVALLALYAVSQFLFWLIILGWNKPTRTASRKRPTMMYAVRVPKAKS